jgi:hypothetical protein
MVAFLLQQKEKMGKQEGGAQQNCISALEHL